MPSKKWEKKCLKCGQVRPDYEYYKYKTEPGQPERYSDLCRSCLTVNIDNFNPDTFLWILQEFDIPYIPRIWYATRDRAIEKAGGKPLTGSSVIGSYMRSMKLSNWLKKGYKDSEFETEPTGNNILIETLPESGETQEQNDNSEKPKRFDPRSVGIADSNTRQPQSDILTIKEQQYKNGEITKDMYDQFVKAMQAPTVMSPNGKGYQGKYASDPGLLLAAANGKDITDAKTEDERLAELDLTKDDVDEDINSLTKEDKIYLINKWGLDYTPSQWISLEQSYNNYIENCEEVTQAITEQVITICKLHLKATEALDRGDMDAFTKMNKAYLDLQKAGKFTEAQNKKEKEGDEITSISQIVEIVEKYGGVIPPYDLSIPKDIIDYEIQDINGYTKNLITNELGFGNLIEDQLNKMRHIQEETLKQQREQEELDKQMEEPSSGESLLKEIYDENKQAIEEAKNSIEPYDPEVPETEEQKNFQKELEEFNTLGQDRIEDNNQSNSLKYSNGKIMENVSHRPGGGTVLNYGS